MNEVGIVVSRYYEDLKWIEQLKAPLDVYVYDRSGPVEQVNENSYFNIIKTHDLDLNIDLIKDNDINFQIIPMADDLGYETSTYSYHLYSRYDKLNDVTAFLQGHPKSYMKNIVSIMNDPYRFARTKYSASNPTPKLEDPLKLTITEELVDFSYLSDCFAYTLPSVDYGWKNYRDDFTKSPWWFFLKKMSGWVENKSDLKELGPMTFGAGNQFMVNKKMVLRHDVDYYKRIHNFVKSYIDESSDRPKWQQKNQGPNIMEATWQFVF